MELLAWILRLALEVVCVKFSKLGMVSERG
jgi:hypothetical protein